MTKNITRTIDKAIYKANCVDKTTLAVIGEEIEIFDLIDSKNIEKAIQEEITNKYDNAILIRYDFISKHKYKCSMPLNDFIRLANTEIVE